MCKQQVHLQLSPSQHPLSPCSSCDSSHCLKVESSEDLQHETVEVVPCIALIKPIVKAEAFTVEVNKIMANMRDIPFTEAKIGNSDE